MVKKQACSRRLTGPELEGEEKEKSLKEAYALFGIKYPEEAGKETLEVIPINNFKKATWGPIRIIPEEAAEKIKVLEDEVSTLSNSVAALQHKVECLEKEKSSKFSLINWLARWLKGIK